MIVDLDAHQGNGHERDFIGDTNTYIFDMYNPEIYPGDTYAQGAISKEIWVTYDTSHDDSYLSLLRQHLPDSIGQFKPDIIYYNAGKSL